MGKLCYNCACRFQWGTEVKQRNCPECDAALTAPVEVPIRRARMLCSVDCLIEFINSPNKPFNIERVELHPRMPDTSWVIIGGNCLPKECEADGELREVTCTMTRLPLDQLAYDVQLAKKPQPWPEVNRLVKDLYHDPYAGLKVVATVFYGGRVYEVMGKEEMDAASFRTMKDMLEQDDSTIFSGEKYRVREVAVRAEKVYKVVQLVDGKPVSQTNYYESGAMGSEGLRDIANYWVEKIGDVKPWLPEKPSSARITVSHEHPVPVPTGTPVAVTITGDYLRSENVKAFGEDFCKVLDESPVVEHLAFDGSSVVDMAKPWTISDVVRTFGIPPHLIVPNSPAVAPTDEEFVLHAKKMMVPVRVSDEYATCLGTPFPSKFSAPPDDFDQDAHVIVRSEE